LEEICFFEGKIPTKDAWIHVNQSTEGYNIN